MSAIILLQCTCIIGMLSKSKGQILRVSAILHTLFSLDEDDCHDLSDDLDIHVSEVITEKALKAAEDFVSVCLKHTAYMAGRGGLDEAIKQAKKGIIIKSVTSLMDVIFALYL